jgi:hypothetical protein
MTRLKKITATALVAASVAVGGLVAAPHASAAPKKYTCAQALVLHNIYVTHAYAFQTAGNDVAAHYWAGKADGIREAFC